MAAEPDPENIRSAPEREQVVAHSWRESDTFIPRAVVRPMQHLMSLCPACRKEINAFQKERRSGAANPQALQILPALLEEQIPRIEKEQRGAARDLADLLALSREERVQRVERARNRFRSAALIRLLIVFGLVLFDVIGQESAYGKRYAHADQHSHA